MPCGVRDSVLSNVSVSGQSLIAGTALIADTVVLEVRPWKLGGQLRAAY